MSMIADEQAGRVVRVHGALACRMYLRGWAIWWPGARVVREGWRSDVYWVTGRVQTFVAAAEAAGCRADMASDEKGW